MGCLNICYPTAMPAPRAAAATAAAAADADVAAALALQAGSYNSSTSQLNPSPFCTKYTLNTPLTPPKSEDHLSTP